MWYANNKPTIWRGFGHQFLFILTTLGLHPLNLSNFNSGPEKLGLQDNFLSTFVFWFHAKFRVCKEYDVYGIFESFNIVFMLVELVASTISF
jgi:hypothetical protein